MVAMVLMFLIVLIKEMEMEKKKGRYIREGYGGEGWVVGFID